MGLGRMGMGMGRGGIVRWLDDGLAIEISGRGLWGRAWGRRGVKRSLRRKTRACTLKSVEIRDFATDDSTISQT